MVELLSTILVIGGAVFFMRDMFRQINNKNAFLILLATLAGCVTMGALILEPAIWGAAVGAFAANVAANFKKIRPALIKGVRRFILRKAEGDMSPTPTEGEEFLEEDR